MTRYNIIRPVKVWTQKWLQNKGDRQPSEFSLVSLFGIPVFKLMRERKDCLRRRLAKTHTHQDKNKPKTDFINVLLLGYDIIF